MPHNQWKLSVPTPPPPPPFHRQFPRRGFHERLDKLIFPVFPRFQLPRCHRGIFLVLEASVEGSPHTGGISRYSLRSDILGGGEREREVGSRRCAAIQIRCNVAKFVLKRRGVTGRFLGVTRVKRAGDGMAPVAENVVASRLDNRVFINTNKVNRTRYAFSRGLKCFRNIERTFAHIYMYTSQHRSKRENNLPG